MSCWEVILYEVAVAQQAEYLVLRDLVVEEMRQRFPGMLGATIRHSADHPALLIDSWEWEDEAKARAAYAGFSSCRHAPQLMKLVQRSVFSGMFLPVEHSGA